MRLNSVPDQWEVIRVDPYDAEAWEVCVISGHFFQDLKELIAICQS